MLSQEEINALLAGASGSGDSSTTDSSADIIAQNEASDPAAVRIITIHRQHRMNSSLFSLIPKRMRLVKYPISVWEQRQRHLVLYLIRK